MTIARNMKDKHKTKSGQHRTDKWYGIIGVSTEETRYRN